jgi:arylsulfatase A-like enzyme
MYLNHRHIGLRITVTGLMLLSITLLSALSAAEPSRPNIVFILADDFGCKDVSSEGSTFYETPNLDRLADSGMRFTQGYAACQVCSPSRASILLGTYPARHGITDWIGAASGMNWNRNDRLLPAEYQHSLPHDSLTLAEALREAGYETFFAGKWHLGDKGSLPEDHGFDQNIGGLSKGSPPGGFFSPYDNPALEDGPKGESLPIRLAEETSRFIGRKRSQPFLAYLSFYSVHAPIETTQSLWKKYRDKAVSGNLPSERFLFDRTMSVRQVQDLPIYAGMVETMDRAIGIVLDSLSQAGLDDNTIVVFTSDNGGVSSGDAFATSNLPLRGGKGRQWEGGIREPFYIRAPGTTSPKSMCDTPVHSIDFYPTLLSLASVPIKSNVDGVDLTPLLKGGSIADRPLFWHYPHYGNQGGEPSSIIRRGDWKLIHYWEDGRDELYNLGQDIGEQTDVASTNPDRVAAMRTELDSWLEQTNAKIPAPDPRFDAAKAKQKLQQMQTNNKSQLEAQHAGYLKENYKPNPDWWGSKVD